MFKMLMKTCTFPLILFFLSFKSFSEITDAQKALVEDLPLDQREKILERMQKANNLQTEIDEIFEEESTLVKKPEIRNLNEEDLCSDCIFGYDYFKYSPTTFAPVSNIPISSDYILGPGDKLSINYFGNEELKTQLFVSREGKLILPLIGAVNVLGLTFQEMVEFLNNKVDSELIGTKISVSLVELRSISVYLLGEAYQPGKYTISGLSSVTNTLFITGGVSENGSLRQIEIRRNNEKLEVYDFYDFLLKGITDSDIRLKDGDVIYVPFIERKVRMGGAFKRPHLYEFKENENIQDAVDMAGGFKFDVNPSSKLELSYVDKKTFSRKLSYISEEDLSRPLLDGDIINVPSTNGLQYKTIKLSGEFNNPGEYSIQEGETVLDIIKRAGGYSENAYSEGGIFLRERVAALQKESYLRTADLLERTLVDAVTSGNLTGMNLEPITSLIGKIRTEKPIGRMVVNLDELALKTDPIVNFIVHNGDTIFIPKRPNSISVAGEVLNPSTLAYLPNNTAQDYINLAGGLNDSSDKDKIFVILPNGQSKVIKKSLFGSGMSLLPGSTIYVSRDPKPFDAIKITSIIMPILSDLATSAAAIAAISDN